MYKTKSFSSVAISKAIIAITIISMLSPVYRAHAEPTYIKKPTVEVQKPATAMPPVEIDGVLVPYEVLVYAQIAYQGHAVTKAYSYEDKGQSYYRLRVDSDSDPTDYDSIALIYNQTWLLITEGQIARPEPTQQNTQKEAPIDQNTENESFEEVSEDVNQIPIEDQATSTGGDAPVPESTESNILPESDDQSESDENESLTPADSLKPTSSDQ